jgi:hypothetical protein
VLRDGMRTLDDTLRQIQNGAMRHPKTLGGIARVGSEDRCSVR